MRYRLMPFVLASAATAFAGCGADSSLLVDSSSHALATGSDGVDTYVADVNAPGVGFFITNLTMTQRLVPGSAGGYKNYALIGIETSKSAAIPGFAGQRSAVSVDTDNIYWDVTLNGSRRGIVGGDVVLSDEDGQPAVNQYCDIKSAAKATQSGIGTCPTQSSVPTCSVDSACEERNSIYTMITATNTNKTYTIVGGYGIGTSAVVFLIKSGSTSGSIGSPNCECPVLSFSAPSIDWNVRAPPSNNCVPGNYKIYPTIGQNFAVAGTGALLYNQEVSATQVSGSDGGVSSTGAIGSVSLSISPLADNGGKYSNTQTTTVTDTSGNPLEGVSITMYENAGKGGGYAHGRTNAQGQFVVKDTYPGPGSYTEWSVATQGSQSVASSKINVTVP
jgi:hypothetical protein